MQVGRRGTRNSVLRRDSEHLARGFRLRRLEERRPTDHPRKPTTTTSTPVTATTDPTATAVLAAYRAAWAAFEHALADANPDDPALAATMVDPQLTG